MRKKMISVALFGVFFAVGGGAWIYAQTNKPIVSTFTDKRDGAGI